MDVETEVASHYTHADLTATVLAALRGAGRDLDALTTADLAPVDEFHLGWHPQTVDFAARLAFPPGTRLLDIGAGVGGPARTFAEAHGCDVTGIDLTPAFVAAATELSARTGLAARTRFVAGSALDLPFEDASFDAATLIHVGMNIADKPRLFAEARRVLRPGATFALYEVMRDRRRPAPPAAALGRDRGHELRRDPRHLPLPPRRRRLPPHRRARPHRLRPRAGPEDAREASPPKAPRSSASTSSSAPPPPTAWAASSPASSRASSPRSRWSPPPPDAKGQRRASAFRTPTRGRLRARSGRLSDRSGPPARESAARQADALRRPGRSPERVSAEAKGLSARATPAIRARLPRAGAESRLPPGGQARADLPTVKSAKCRRRGRPPDASAPATVPRTRTSSPRCRRGGSGRRPDHAL